MEIPGDAGIVARLFQACINTIKLVITEGVDDESLQAHVPKFKRVHHSLALWNIDHSVENGNLDSILQRAQGLQKATLIPLRSIARILAFGLSTFTSPFVLF